MNDGKLRQDGSRGWCATNWAAAAAVAIGAWCAPIAAQAQSAIIYGSLGNFDISNDTGRTCHGFAVDLDGVRPDQVPYSFSAERYGAPTVTPTASGVQVRWESPWDAVAQQFAERTLPHTVPWFPGQCYQWNPSTYQDSGCEHFGTGATANAVRASARWLCEDPTTPGSLLAVDPPTSVPMPDYYVVPPVRAADPPQLVVEVEAPEPAESPELYGEAQWMRVYRTELPREVSLDELVADNAQVVPMDASQLEADYSIIQDEPAAGGKGNRKRKRNQGPIDPTTRAVVRRIEMWEFTGAYDPVTNEALCADLTCNVPAPGEIGRLLSVQMTVANVQPDALLVTRAGSGSVESSDKLVSCGNKCNQPYQAGATVTLSAKASSGATFMGWTGACRGTQTTCQVAVNGQTRVGASFATLFGLKVSRSGTGTVTGTPAGQDVAIACGKDCTAKFPAGQSVVLTATPGAGKQFLGWSGACSGTTASCTVQVNGNVSVQANFSK